ncbi:MAG: EAL domain-containing protein [Steroidobacteraceae bacterium]
MKSFRTRILALVLGLVTVTVVATVTSLVAKAGEEAREQAGEQLRAGLLLSQEVLDFRASQLRAAVRVLAADYGFRAAIASADGPTILSAVENHAARVRAGLVVLLDPQGRPIVATAGDLAQQALGSLAEVTTHRPGASRAGLHLVGGRPYQLVAAPVRAPDTIAWVIMGFPVDDALAAEIARLGNAAVTFAGSADGAPVYTASSLPPPQRPSPATALHAASGTLLEFDLGGAGYFGRVVSLPVESGTLRLLLSTPVAEALRPYQELRQSILLIGGGVLLVAALLAVWLANGATRPVAALTESARRIEAGDYSFEVSAGSDREFGRLAAAFNSMRSAVGEREGRILHQARHDPLTGLPNRAYAAELLEQRVAGGIGPVSACVVDLQRFRDVNASLGHAVGDSVLREVAARLAEEGPARGRVARIAADKFLVVLERCAEAAREELARIAARLRTGIDAGGVRVLLDVRAGIACWPDHAASGADLLRGADVALDKAKESGVAIGIYVPGDEAEYRRRIGLLGELPGAIAADELSLHFQPKVGSHCGRVIGCEALLRWHSPRHGHIAPSEFVAYAERTGAMRLLTSWVLRSALRQLRAWEDAGHDWHVAVNLSASDLANPGLALEVVALLDETRANPARLVLEITESTVMRELANALRVMEPLRALGVRFAIDDFGTGYSSLASLQQLPVDELKIDRAFVRNLGSRASDAAIVRSIVDLAHSMSLKVVAEGVEDGAALAVLRDLDCDVIQGYHYSKPLPPAEFARWACAHDAALPPAPAPVVLHPARAGA